MGPTRWAAFLLLLILPIVSAGIFSDPAISYCKCICFSNSTIIPLWHPADTSKPCLSCTRQFCLDQKLPICRDAQVPELDTDVGTGTEGDVEARCFKRDSPRDQLVVTFFCLIIVGLLLFAAVRSRLRKAIDARGRPQDMREWSHALLPTQLHSATSSFFPVSRPSGPETYFDAGDIGPGTGIGRGTGDYEPVSMGAPRP